jgi:TetR/AcrR family transcriptional regulator, transcriptional repressor for nem operon
MHNSPPHKTETRGPGRPREFVLEDVLDKAIAVFSELGFHATSLGKLTAAIGITEGSLYKAFRDKYAVFIAAFERYVELRSARLHQATEKAQTGRQRVQAMLAVYAESSHGSQGRRGCLVVGSAVDLASSDPEMAKRVTDVLKAHEKRIADYISQGQQDGSIAPGVDPESMGRLLLCVVQGMRVLGKTGRSRGEMLDVVEHAMKLLD